MMPFAAQLGIELTAATPEEVTGRLAWREDLCTTGGRIHGRALMALADSLGGVCAFLNLAPGAGTATILDDQLPARPARGPRRRHVAAAAAGFRSGGARGGRHADLSVVTGRAG